MTSTAYTRPLITLLLAGLTWGLQAQTCLPDWNYYQPIRLQNTSGTTLTDFQVRIDMPLASLVAAGKLRPDWADLRIMDSLCQPLPFYADSSLTPTSHAVWVRVPSLPAGQTLELVAYYSNPQAQPAADGDATFLFFDDFTTPAVDLTKWEAIGQYATWEHQDGTMRYASFYNTTVTPAARFKFARTRRFFAEPVVFDFRVKHTRDGNNFGFGSSRDLLNRYLLRYSSGASDTLGIPAVMTDTTSNGYATITNWPWLTVPRSSFQELAIQTRVDSSDYLVIDRIENQTLQQVVTTPLQFNYFPLDSISFVISTFESSRVITIASLKVRKPGPQPTVTFEPEVLQGNPAAVPDPRLARIRVFPNPTTGWLNIETDLRILHWTLRDMQGRLQQETHGSADHLDLQSLPAGLYLLEAHTSDPTPVRQLIQRH